MGFIDGLLGNAGVVDPETLQSDYEQLFIEDELIEVGFKLIRDVFIFTTKRLILVDKQGMTGKKTEVVSLPYKSISRYSLETAGHFDLDAELKIWISGTETPAVSKRFNKKVNIYDLQKVLANHVL